MRPTSPVRCGERDVRSGPGPRRGRVARNGLTVAAVIRVAATIGAVWLVLVALAWTFQRQLIYLPDTSGPTPPAAVEEVGLVTDDGLELIAWFVAVDDPTSTVLVTPGNAGNRSLRLPLAQGLADRGHQVLLLDYRGYGGNPGRPQAEGLAADARAAHDHLAARDDVDADRIVHLGESIGTGVAAGLAADRQPAAVVLRSPFPELADVGASAYPFLPVRTLLRERLPVTEPLAPLDLPVLVVAGEADRIVPTRLSERVAADLGADLEVVAGVGHNDRALLDGAAYLDAVDGFVRSVLR